MTRPEFETVDEMIRAREGDPNPAILFEDEQYSWADHVAASAARAALANDLRHDGPFHIGYLFENTPELSFWLGAGAVAGATLVGINPTRQGAELARDITYTDCQLIVTESRFVGLLHGLDLGLEHEHRVLVPPRRSHPTPRRCSSSPRAPRVRPRPSSPARAAGPAPARC
jgi:fatty-acyl-CoA synthase